MSTMHDYAPVAVLADLYGNLWDLVQFATGGEAVAALGQPSWDLALAKDLA